MKKILALAVASAALVVSAFAGEMEGTVKEVKAEEMIIILEDGTELKVAEGVSLEGVAAGVAVKVTTDDANTVTVVEVK